MGLSGGQPCDQGGGRDTPAGQGTDACSADIPVEQGLNRAGHNYRQTALL